MKILVDAMGGDYAPREIVKGCVDAINEKDGFTIDLIGDDIKIKKLLEEMNCNSNRIEVSHASEVVSNCDQPTKVIKTKKDSSMVIGFNKLKNKQGDVFVSAGSTGALLTGALFIVGRLKGILRPALAPIVPSNSNGTIIVDAGMNTSCKPANFLQFATMGSIYMREIRNVKKPRVGLVNVGSEEQKGNNETKEIYSLLKNSNLNFVGNIEGSDIPLGNVDVAVCDGFTGNAMLKMMEGTGKLIINNLKEVFQTNIFSKLSALVIKKPLKGLMKKMDANEIGGTPILGINGVIYKCHGNSNSKSIKATILNACEFSRKNLLEKIKSECINMEVDVIGNTKVSSRNIRNRCISS